MKQKSTFYKLLACTLTTAMLTAPLLSVQAEEPDPEVLSQQTELLMEQTEMTEIVIDTATEVSEETLLEISEDSDEAEASDVTVEDIAEEPVPEEETITIEESLPDLTRVSVHDPSIFKSQEGTYYVLGSHTASAVSDDLMAWTQLNTDYGDPENTPFYGNLLETFAKPFEWAGYNDGDCVGGYAVWAPDVIWNPYYAWEDGSTGAYMIYCCTSSTWRRSCISYLVSKTADGTYEYADTIVYSGFTTTGDPDGNSTRDTKWDNDYLNLSALIEKGSENGGIDEISDNWFLADGSWNNNYAPNAIDPNVFFDASGEKFYMSYGSWSGGLFLLELDPATGEAIYPGVDSVDELSGNYVDRYFGIHLAGGNHQSGEAPYIKYDQETGYYYLYETYGGLTAEGGYNMRLFRSENPSGPYLDASGNNAADSGSANDLYGIKLIGNYSFYNQTGKRAAGHNSALLDDDGSRYLVYHQRFDIEPQLEAHEVRVHQQFLNEDLWPVTAVYEYRGDAPENYDASQVTGSYEFINHGTSTSGEMLSTQLLTLNEDGSTEGAFSGTWEKTDSGKGYDYVTLRSDEGVTYKGIFFLQHKEDAAATEVMTFTAIGDDNTSVWGSMADLTDEAMVTGMVSATVDGLIPSAINSDLELPTSLLDADIVWTSDNENIFSSAGVYNAPDEDEKVVLTAEITCGATTVTNTYKVRVRSKASLIYAYDFETPAEDGVIAPAADSAGEGSAVLTGSAAIIQDETRGNVLQVTNEPDAKGVNYLLLPEDTFSTIASTGYTVAFWTNIGEETFEHSALFEADAANEYPLTRIGANLIARINAGAYSDVTDSMLSTTGERGVWQHVVYTVDPYGIKVYLNGELIGEENKDIAECFKKKNTGIYKATHVMVGSGYIWDDEDCQNALFDDVMIYKGTLSSADIAELYISQIK